jgi:rare lipoprotein A
MGPDRCSWSFDGRRRRALLLIVIVALSTSCARKKQVRVPLPPVPGSVEQGIASWYGHPYHGRRAANGEIYDMEKLPAAHRTLPFGSWVEVENLTNGRKVQVRVTDRGPFVEGRIIDLSRGAARQIEMLGAGIVQVRLVVIEPPPGIASSEVYAVQVGAFQNQANAQRLAETLGKRYAHCHLVRRDSSSPAWRVLVGRESSLDAAGELARQLRQELGSAFVVRLDEQAPDSL